jgi:SPP1 gp7 family putative phage head morphogenesis protein
MSLMATVPVDARKVERLLTSFERKLSRAEAQTIRRLARGLLDAQNRLLGQLQGPYNLTLGGSRELGRAVREARARSLLQQVGGLLEIIPATARADLEDLVREGAMLGVESANALTTLYDPQLVASFSVVPQEAVLAAASNSYSRLLVHGEEFAARATQSIVSGIARGSSWRKVATEIRQATGVTRRHAETIVATESAQAHDEGHRAAYADQGIEYVQRLATLDVRTCPTCAARAGSVYRLGETQAVLHPRDRCRLVPWKPEWQAAGLTDDTWVREHKRGIVAQLEKEGKRPSYGLAPFEKAAGLTEPPKPVWTP